MLMRRFVLSLIKVYQYFISPLYHPVCRFYPSCSEYTRHAVELHGVFKGLLLGLIRLLKCHPWHPGGLNPVPERFSWSEVFHGR